MVIPKRLSKLGPALVAGWLGLVGNLWGCKVTQWQHVAGWRVQVEGGQLPRGRGSQPARPALLTPGEKPGPVGTRPTVRSLSRAWKMGICSSG